MSGESGAKRNQQQKSAFICTMILRLLHYLPSCCLSLSNFRSVPAEGDVTGSVASLFHQGFVKLAAGARMDGRPAVLAVVL